MDNVGRREALRWLGRLPVWAALALAAVQQACMGDATTGQYPMGGLMSCPNAACIGGKVPMMDLHCHPTCLSAADLAAGVDVVLTMADGGTGHTHTVTLTATQLATLAGGGSVPVTSSVASPPPLYGNHAHSVKFG